MTETGPPPREDTERRAKDMAKTTKVEQQGLSYIDTRVQRAKDMAEAMEVARHCKEDKGSVIAEAIADHWTGMAGRPPEDPELQAAREGIEKDPYKMGIIHEVMNTLKKEGRVTSYDPETATISQAAALQAIAEAEQKQRIEWIYITGKDKNGKPKDTDKPDYILNAERFVKRHHIVYRMTGRDILDARPIYWIYRHGRYVVWDDPPKTINQTFFTKDGQAIKRHQCSELLEQIRTISPRIGQDIEWAELSADSNKHYWNCKNHIVVLERGKTPEIISHDPTIHTTHQLKVEHDPHATEPEIFNAYLDKVTGGDGFMRRAILEFLTQCITARRPPKLKRRAYIIVGPGAAGKSALTRIVQSFIPQELLGSYNIADFGDRFGNSQLDGITHVFTSISDENSERMLGAPEKLKTMVFGEQTQINEKYKPKTVIHAPNVTFGFLMNRMVSLPLNDQGGLLRRLMIIQYEKPFEGADHDIEAKMHATELPGIMNLLIETDQSMIDGDGPRAVRDVTKELDMYYEARLKHNELNVFLDYGVGEYCEISEINQLLKIHCMHHGIKYDKSTYHNYFEARGCHKTRSSKHRTLEGVSINEAGKQLIEDNPIPDRGLKKFDADGNSKDGHTKPDGQTTGSPPNLSLKDTDTGGVT